MISSSGTKHLIELLHDYVIERLLLSLGNATQVVDTKRLDLDRVMNLEELRAYFATIAKYLRAKEMDAIESTLGDRDRESKEKIARPLGRMQVA